MVSEIQIFDDYLHHQYWKDLENRVLRNEKFNWRFVNHVADRSRADDINDFYFINPCFEIGKIKPEFEYLERLLTKLNPHTLYRVKCNLHPRTDTRHEFGWHIDSVGAPREARTAIYYINSNDGETHIYENGEVHKVESVANRLVTFPTYLNHRGTSCTNASVRSVININYFPLNMEPIEEVPNGI